MHSSVFLFLNIGTGEMMLIFFVALLLFGGEKMPGIARTLGRGIRDFKNASEDVKREINNQINNFDEKKPRKTPVEEIAAETTNVAEEPVSEETENLEANNHVDNNVTDEAAPADEPENKTINLTKPDNIVEYKG